MSTELALVTGEFEEITNIIRDLEYFKYAKKILDIECGTGLYPIFIAKTFPNIEIYALDLPYIIRNITRKIVEAYKLQDRIRLIPADFTKDDIDKNYDIVLDIGAVSPLYIDVLKKIYNALNSNGILISKHIFLDAKGQEHSLLATLFEYLQIGRRITATLEEAINNIQKAKFKIVKIIDLKTRPGHKIIISKK